MPFNISEFKANIGKYGGIARDNLFYVTITPPAINVDIEPLDLRFFCRSVNLPGLVLQTTDVQTQGYGLAEKRPINLPLDNLNTVFMVDSTFKVKQFFHKWMQSIINFNNSKGYNFEYNGMLPFETAYKSSYVGKIQIVVYSYSQSSVRYVYNFGNAYPVAVGEITTAWENTDSIMVMPVQFAYDVYELENFATGIYSPRINATELFGGSNLQRFVTTIGDFGQAIGSQGINNSIQNAIDDFNTIANDFDNILSF